MTQDARVQDFVASFEGLRAEVEKVRMRWARWSRLTSCVPSTAIGSPICSPVPASRSARSRE